jgi:hypothetical protein
VSNAFAFIFFKLNLVQFFQELNPAVHYNLDRRTPALKDFHCHQGYECIYFKVLGAKY